MELRFDPAAMDELVGSLDWYAARSGRAASMFTIEFERAVLLLREAPLRWPTFQHGTRRIRLRRFPFAIVYRVNADELQVIAVAHLHRRPGYWRNRTLG
ncbi:MAG: type II toxin-antitoxin system RelE/ParE family toxin [Planctomycetes bacterium]|nr:type II toxin-antitoxin system RelE/ParE family toxin [Planctomycetota bacterium]